jgi:transcriptional regulator of aromatic amino acid metabolism
MVMWSPRDTPRLPAVLFRTLIVRDVDCLTATQQRRLGVLLAESAHTVQVVSIARRPPFLLVRNGRFLETLYYRLNVVLFEAGRESLRYVW